MSDERKCCKKVPGEGQWGYLHMHQCQKSAALEHEGQWYCKTHHPPSRGAREAAKPKCAKCGYTSVTQGQKYCRCCATVELGRDAHQRLLADAARLDFCERIAAEHPELARDGLRPMTRAEIDAAMREEQARSFAYGNVKLHNPAITREDIDKAADALDLAMRRERDEALRVRDLARAASNRDLEAKRSASTPWHLESRVAEWVRTRIGEDHLHSAERAMRLFEEATELAQAEGISCELALKQVRHVYDRPTGEPSQEAAGVAVCLLGWCASKGQRFVDLAIAELERIEAKPIEQIRGSLARKADADLVVIPSPVEQDHL